MLWFGLKKLFRKEREKIVKSFEERDKVIDDIKGHLSADRDEINLLKNKVVSRDEILLLIENMVLKCSVGASQTTPQTTSGITPQTTPRTNLRRKAERLLDKAEVMKEIKSLSERGFNTSALCEEIVDIKQLCGKTCFYKYLKEYRANFGAKSTKSEANLNLVKH